ncbi:tyrosine-type recombinase/integrase [Kineothrix sedimenti]|uniref:tyrosine-type recombinase/integrase n=1 Tax=Kineothrix sedimenti TaxID=3123317 RepID=UPI003CC82C2C
MKEIALSNKRYGTLKYRYGTALVLMLNTGLRAGELMAISKDGRFPTNRNIQETLNRILRKCGIKHYSSHTLRHTFATKLLSKTSSHQELKR